MISPLQIKFIKSLHHKKGRVESKMFAAEGVKVVNDLINRNFNIKEIYATATYIQKHKAFLNHKPFAVTEISEKTLERISILSTPNEVLAVCGIVEHNIMHDDLKNKWCVVLDEINDPGNLGTIIRSTHWFGIDTIICSPNTVDVYNPKAVQSSMGSLAAVKVIYTDLSNFLKDASVYTSIFGTMLNGSNYLEQQYPQNGILVFGSESHGIRSNLSPYIHHKISIPFTKADNRPDSLNVSVSAGIVLAELYAQKCL